MWGVSEWEYLYISLRIVRGLLPPLPAQQLFEAIKELFNASKFSNGLY